MVAESQIGQVRDFPAYLHFTPRPDQPERFDEQTGFYNFSGDGVAWLLGGNGAGCLAAEQLVFDPVFGGDRRVSEIDSDFHVIARNADGIAVVAKAERPQIYGIEDLWQITLSTGQIMRVTKGHRLLTLAGWREIEDILKSDCHAERSLQNTPGTHEVTIVAAEFLRTDSYWDFHVPEYENYWMAGVWNHNTTSCLIAKICRFVCETPPPRKDTPFWVIAGTYDQIGRMWDEKFDQQGHLPKCVIDRDRIHWNKVNNNWPYRVPLKPWDNGNNWCLEFKSWMQGRHKMQAASIGGFGFIEQFPWGLFEEVYRGCREYNLPGSKLCEYTPVDPDLSLELEEMLENGHEPETGRIPGARYLPKDWKIFHANTLCAVEAGHVDRKWFDEFFGMIPEDMLETRMKGLFSTFEGIIYKDFNVATHVMGDEMWGRIADCEHRRGIDWGAGPENDFACVWGARNSRGQWFIYDEEVCNDQSKTTVDHLTDVVNKWEWPETDKRYGTTYCDPSSPDNLRIAMKLNQYNPAVPNMTMMRGKNSVLEGIEHIQYLLKPQVPVIQHGPDGKPVIDPATGKAKVKLEPKLFIHRQCKKLIQCMKTYRWLRGSDPNAKLSRNPRDPQRAPLKKNDHVCFGGDTPVLMADGTTKPIQLVRAGDLVISHRGVTKVLAAGCTGIKKTNIITGTTCDILYTESHPWYNMDSGLYCPLQEVTTLCKLNATQREMEHWLNEYLHSDTGGIDTQRVGTIPFDATSADTQEKARMVFLSTTGCTRKHGFNTLVKYLKDTTFITSMKTQPTMISATCSALLKRTMQHCTQITCSQRRKRLKIGTDLKPDGSGTVSMGKQCTPICRSLHGSANTATPHIRQKQIETKSNIAQITANQQHAEQGAMMTQYEYVQSAEVGFQLTNTRRQLPVLVSVLPFKCPSQVRQGPTVAVYNLTTEDGTFFADGLLTSNCDAARYCIYSEDAMHGGTIASAKLDSRIIAQTNGQYLPPGGVKGFLTRHRDNREQ